MGRNSRGGGSSCFDGQHRDSLSEHEGIVFSYEADLRKSEMRSHELRVCFGGLLESPRSGIQVAFCRESLSGHHLYTSILGHLFSQIVGEHGRRLDVLGTAKLE